MKLYYYFSPSGDAYQNLAQDEYLLTHLPPDTHLLYFYVNQNAVIIGRNQNPWAECDLTALKADEVQLVRRITGGGAVYHDGGNLNFSFTSPADLYDTDKQDDILLAALRSLGISAEKNGRNDLVADGHKFSGNAFGSRGDNRLRHGTLLISADLSKMGRYLTVSAKKLRAKGVSSVRSRVCNLREFCPELDISSLSAAIRRQFEQFYGMTAEEICFTPEEETEIRALREKRASFDWVMGEAPAFDYTFEERFSFGMAQFCVSVADGKISRIALYTDSLDTDLPEKAKNILMGLNFSPEAISRALTSAEEPELKELAAYIAENL